MPFDDPQDGISPLDVIRKNKKKEGKKMKKETPFVNFLGFAQNVQRKFVYF